MTLLSKLHYINVEPLGTFRPSGNPDYDSTPEHVDAIFNHLREKQDKRLLIRIRLAALFILFTVILLSCNSDQSKTKNTNKRQENALVPQPEFCSKELNAAQRQTVLSTISYIQTQVNAMKYCDKNYNPGQHCDVATDIRSTCHKIFYDLQGFFRDHPTLTFCISTEFGNDWLAAVDVKASNEHIYFSEKFFRAATQEQQRTLIHELYHLWGSNTPHPDQKDCVYYKNWTLKAEHCLTCEASLFPMELSTCSGKDGLFITK